MFNFILILVVEQTQGRFDYHTLVGKNYKLSARVLYKDAFSCEVVDSFCFASCSFLAVHFFPRRNKANFCFCILLGLTLVLLFCTDFFFCKAAFEEKFVQIRPCNFLLDLGINLVPKILTSTSQRWPVVVKALEAEEIPLSSIYCRSAELLRTSDKNILRTKSSIE